RGGVLLLKRGAGPWVASRARRSMTTVADLTRRHTTGVAPFTFADLFAGVGGFHAALGALGGHGVFASEIDPVAADVYRTNWDTGVHGDIIPMTQDRMDVPAHDVLAAGFPCQPFSKSGFQKGMAETRGTLFFNIARVLEERR